MRKETRSEVFNRLSSARKKKLVEAFISLRKIINKSNYSFTQEQCVEFIKLNDEQRKITLSVMDREFKRSKITTEERINFIPYSFLK